MKTIFTKTLFGIIAILCFTSNANLIFAQWTFNTMGNNYVSPVFTSQVAKTNGTVGVTYSGERLRSTVVPEGLVLKGRYLYDEGVYNQALNDGIQSALSTIPIEKWFKAKVGKSETIQLNYQYNKNNNLPNRPQQVNNFVVNSSVLLGSKDIDFPFQNSVGIAWQYRPRERPVAR